MLDRAHRIGRPYKDKNDVEQHNVIVRFTTHRHRTLVYRNRKQIEESCGYRFRLDLTKERFLLLKEAIELVRNFNNVTYVYSDVNCRLKVKLNDNSEAFFNDIKELNNILGI